MLNRLLVSLGLRAKPALGPNDLGFFDPRDTNTGFLSNFYRSPFQLQGFEWPSVEHFYQAHKCRDPLYQRQVRTAMSPKGAKSLGRAAAYLTMRPDWADWRMTVMVSALVAKFAQNPKLADALLATGDQILVETSPEDAFWGHGRDGRGENRLGYLLITLREVLRGCREQGELMSEIALLQAVVSGHLEWWAFEAARAKAQQQVMGDGLGIMVRDANLTEEQFNRYHPSAVVLEPAFLTGSADYLAGLAARYRFVLLSPSVKSLGQLSLHAEAQPCMCPANSYWKVMGRFVENEMGCIVLWQVPEKEAYLFDSAFFSDLEAAVYLPLRKSFIEMLAAQPIPACLTPEWLEQVSDPVGFTAEGNFKELWINGMAQPSPSVRASPD